MTPPGVSVTTSRRRSRAACNIAVALAAAVTACLLVAYLAAGIVIALAAYLVVAYVVLPWLWFEHETRYPALAGLPKVTHNAAGVPGDPLNVGLIGHRTQVIQALLAVGWRPADVVTLVSSVKIVGSVLFHWSYVTAPMSALYVFGRRQDLAFEREVGSSASQRHHVRWWRTISRTLSAGRCGSAPSASIVGSGSAIVQARSRTTSILTWTPSATS